MAHLRSCVPVDPALLDTVAVEPDPVWRDTSRNAETRILSAMHAAGLTAREIDAYWLSVGCEWLVREIAERHRLPRSTTKRAIERAEQKLAQWVTTEGITASPLYGRRHR